MATQTVDFTQRLSAHAARVEAFLETQLAGCETGRAHAPPERLTAAMRHAVLSGGKRLRPFLVFETAGVFGCPPERVMAVAGALECVHCYSLVHDDLPAMDNDELRRGKPTVWAAYDEWTAILAGDALLTLAFELLTQLPDTDQSEGERDPANALRIAQQRLWLVRHLARFSGWQGMVGGQCIDLEADKLGKPAVADEAHVRRLQEMKTGALIEYACQAGAVFAGARSAQLDCIARYGKALGLAFQIADDLLDVEGSPEVVGKATGKDAAAGKATLVSILGTDGARAELLRARDQALADLRAFGAEADYLRAAAEFIVSRDR